MAYICRLIEGTEPAIDLQYNPAAGWSLLNRGIQIADPQVFELWGGQREDQLVRREYGKRVIPLRLSIEEANGVDLIDSVNALEERLQHAARYRVGDWGDEVFLELQIDDSTDTVQFPVCSGEIDKAGLYEMCGGEPDDMMDDVPITLNCEAYWEDDSDFALENYVYNPAFFRGAVAPGDSWTEDDVPGALTLAWNTTIWERMGRSLEWTIAPAGANDLGIQGDNLTVVASTQYYVEYRGYHTAGCDDITARVYDVSNGAVIAASIQVFNNGDNAWEKLGVAFTTPVGCVLARIEVYRLLGDSTAGNKTFYCDAFYLDQRGTAPTGWVSGRNLGNHMDHDADHLNVLCVAELPGEVEAEVNLVILSAQEQGELHVAKRTREDVHNYLWQLLPCEAYTRFETGGGGGCVPGLTDAMCWDSDKIGDATSPSGSRIEVDFAVRTGWEHRCYWDIITNEQDYHGDFVLAVICKASGATDTISMRVEAWDSPSGAWGQGGVTTQAVPVPATKDWWLLDGWEVMHYRIGTYDRQWPGGVNDRLRVVLRASTDGAPTDSLYIAGAYVVPVSESYLVTGMPLYYPPAGTTWNVKQMDGSKGVFTEGATYSLPSLGAVGSYPLLTANKENYLYLAYTRASELTIADTMIASIEYRPRGIFLRGTNP